MSTLFKLGTAAGAALLLIALPARLSSHNPTATTVVFDREVAAILNQKCAQCHGASGMAMPLQTYADVRPWSVAIKEEILARRMPPWPAERGYGAFANDVSLTPRERDFLLSWIDGGARPGTGEPPAHMDHGAHWMLGEPGVVLSTWAPANVPARAGAGLTARFIIDPGLASDSWLRAFDFKPGDRRAVRAAFFSIAGTDQYLGGWTPWATTMELPGGAAIRLPAKSTLAVDVVYGPESASRAMAPDAPRLGLYFAGPPARPVSTLVLAGDRVTAGGRMKVVQTMADDRTLFGVRVEMSGGGRAVELKALRPDGAAEPLLLIREFRPEWQTPYVFQAPVRLPRGSVLVAVASFDGSAVDAPRLRVSVSAAP